MATYNKNAPNSKTFPFLLLEWRSEDDDSSKSPMKPDVRTRQAFLFSSLGTQDRKVPHLQHHARLPVVCKAESPSLDVEASSRWCSFSFPPATPTPSAALCTASRAPARACPSPLCALLSGRLLAWSAVLQSITTGQSAKGKGFGIRQACVPAVPFSRASCVTLEN